MCGHHGQLSRLWDPVSIWQRPLGSGRLGRACQWPDDNVPTEISIPAHLKAVHERKYSSNVGLDKKEECPPTCMHASNSTGYQHTRRRLKLWLLVLVECKRSHKYVVKNNLQCGITLTHGKCTNMEESVRPSLVINIRISTEIQLKNIHDNMNAALGLSVCMLQEGHSRNIRNYRCVWHWKIN